MKIKKKEMADMSTKKEMFMLGDLKMISKKVRVNINGKMETFTKEILSKILWTVKAYSKLKEKREKLLSKIIILPILIKF